MVKEFKELFQSNDIEFNVSGIESHNLTGSGERYHAFLRQIYNRVHESNSSTAPIVVLKLSMKAVNHTIRPKWALPTLLTFSVLSRLPVNFQALPNQLESIEVLSLANKQMTKLIIFDCVQRGLWYRGLVAADYDIRIGNIE